MAQKVRKAVILVAGFGTRFLPATKAIPKEMLPVLDKPGLQYTVEEAVSAGITDIIFVTGRSKRAIEDHFDANAELENTLERAGKEALLKEVKRATELANFIYVRQNYPLGAGHATLAAKAAVGNEPFLALYPDDFIVSKENTIKKMIDVYEEYQTVVMGLYRVAKRDVVKYGIAKTKEIRKNLYEVLGVVEKPSIATAPSQLASLKGFVFPPEIFSYIQKVKPKRGAEIHLPAAVELYNKDRSVMGCELHGTLFDLGSKIGWLKANIALALENKEYAKEIHSFLRHIA